MKTTPYTPGLTFEEESHTYYLDGVVIPSVTQILKEVGLVDFSGIDPEVLQKAADRGTYVHKCCELLFHNDLEIDAIDPEAVGYVNGFQKFLADQCGQGGFTILEMEKSVFHPILRYAGTLDILAQRGKENWILDIKTGSPQISYSLQTAAYENCFTEVYRRACLYLSKDGKYRLHPYTDNNDVRVWQACVGIYHWKQNAKKGKS